MCMYVIAYYLSLVFYTDVPVLGRWGGGVDGYMYTGVSAMYAQLALIGNEKDARGRNTYY